MKYYVFSSRPVITSKHICVKGQGGRGVQDLNTTRTPPQPPKPNFYIFLGPWGPTAAPGHGPGHNQGRKKPKTGKT